VADRHAGAKQTASWTSRAKDAQERWETYVAPEVARLENEIGKIQDTVDQLVARRERQGAAYRLGVDRRWSLQCDAHQLAVGLDSHRDRLGGIPRPAPRRPQGQTRKPQVPAPTPQPEPMSRSRLGM